MKLPPNARGKLAASLAIGAALAVAALYLIASQGWIMEEILIRRLQKGDLRGPRGLGELRSVRAVPHLIDSMRESGAMLEPCVEALARIGRPAIGKLKDLLEDRSAHSLVRGHAAGALGEIGFEARTAVPSVLRLLKEPAVDPVSYTRGLIALGKLGVADEEVMVVLLDALSGPDLDLSRHAAEAVARLGDSAAGAVPGRTSPALPTK